MSKLDSAVHHAHFSELSSEVLAKYLYNEDGTPRDDADGADKRKEALRELLVRYFSAKEGFGGRTRGRTIGVASPKDAIVSLAEMVFELTAFVDIQKAQMQELQTAFQNVQRELATLAHKPEFVDVVTANTIYEVIGRGDHWSESYDVFSSINSAEEDSLGAVRLSVTEGAALFIVSAQKVEEVEGQDTPNISYVPLPNKFWGPKSGMFHAIIAWMRRSENRLVEGRPLYITFTGSESLIDLLPEDYELIDTSIDANIAESEQMRESYIAAVDDSSFVDSEGVVHLKEDIDPAILELFPDGKDSDGDPINLQAAAAVVAMDSVRGVPLNEQNAKAFGIEGEALSDEGRDPVGGAERSE